MALINCPACANPLSDKAASCPRCGHPLTDQDELLRKLITATVRVECEGHDGKTSRGTGFIVGDGSFLVTAYHVVRNAKEVRAVRFHQPRENPLKHGEAIKVDSWTKGSYLVGVKHGAPDPPSSGPILTGKPGPGTEVVWSLDISTLHLESPFNNTTALEFDREYAWMGEEVFFVGYPRGGVEFKPDYERFAPMPLTTKAIVSFATKYGLAPVEEYYYWLDRPSFPGNSGGPVMRLKTGKIVGVISATPFMPTTIATKQGKMSALMPSGYSIAIGTTMLRESIEHSIQSGDWKKGLKPN